MNFILSNDTLNNNVTLSCLLETLFCKLRKSHRTRQLPAYSACSQQQLTNLQVHAGKKLAAPASNCALPSTFLCLSYFHMLRVSNWRLLATMPTKILNLDIAGLTLAVSILHTSNERFTGSTEVNSNLALMQRLWPWEVVCTHPQPLRDLFHRALV